MGKRRKSLTLNERIVLAFVATVDYLPLQEKLIPYAFLSGTITEELL